MNHLSSSLIMKVVLLRCNQHQCCYRDTNGCRPRLKGPPTLCCYPNEGGKGLRALAKGATLDSGGRERPISRGRLRHQPVLPQCPLLLLLLLLLLFFYLFIYFFFYYYYYYSIAKRNDANFGNLTAISCRKGDT